MAKRNFKRVIFALTTAAATVVTAIGCGDSTPAAKRGRPLSGGHELAQDWAENAVWVMVEARHFSIYNRYHALLDAGADGVLDGGLADGDGLQHDDLGDTLLRCSVSSPFDRY